MKYKIELCVRALNTELYQLTEEQLEEAKSYDELSDYYFDVLNWNSEEPYYAGAFFAKHQDRFSLEIRNENNEVVFEMDNIKEYVKLDKTHNEDGDIQVEGYEFAGVEDGDYLVRIVTTKGICGETEVELEEFDTSKLYLVQSDIINDELMGDTIFNVYELYYQQGEGYDKERDIIYLDPIGDEDEQYTDVSLMNVKEKDLWSEYEC